MNEFTFVYRLEHKDTGIGPFQMGYSKTLSGKDRELWIGDLDIHPREIECHAGEYYGCLSPESVKEYFGMWYERLLNSGYELGVYYVKTSNIVFGQDEVVFKL